MKAWHSCRVFSLFLNYVSKIGENVQVVRYLLACLQINNLSALLHFFQEFLSWHLISCFDFREAGRALTRMGYPVSRTSAAMVVEIIFSSQHGTELKTSVVCAWAPFVVSHSSLPLRQLSQHYRAAKCKKAKKARIWHKCDRCLYTGLRALVSTARFTCSLSPLITQRSGPIISAFPASMTKKFKHHQLCCTWKKKKYQKDQNY